MQEQNFEFIIDGLPYLVKVIPFEFNSEIRYRVSYNGGEENIFVWDAEVKQLRAIDDDAATLPDDLEIAISEKLRSAIY